MFGFVDKDEEAVEGGEGVELDMGTGIESTEGEVFGIVKVVKFLVLELIET